MARLSGEGRQRGEGMSCRPRGKSPHRAAPHPPRPKSQGKGVTPVTLEQLLQAMHIGAWPPDTRLLA